MLITNKGIFQIYFAITFYSTRENRTVTNEFTKYFIQALTYF